MPVPPARPPAHPITPEFVEELFTLKKPTEAQAAAMDRLSRMARAFALEIVELVPAGPGQTIALRKLAETRMAVNSAILFEGAW